MSNFSTQAETIMYVPNFYAYNELINNDISRTIVIIVIHDPIKIFYLIHYQCYILLLM